MLVDFFLTHLESLSASIRKKQIEELAKFISIHTGSERPVYLTGDLNVVGPRRGMRSEEECDTVYQHVYDSYQGEGRSIYAAG